MYESRGPEGMNIGLGLPGSHSGTLAAFDPPNGWTQHHNEAKNVPLSRHTRPCLTHNVIIGNEMGSN